MINRPALKTLIAFNESPIPANARELREIPALYNALQFEAKRGGSYSAELLSVCMWMESRALEVLATLTIGHSMPETGSAGTEDWRKVGFNCICSVRLSAQAPTDWMLL